MSVEFTLEEFKRYFPYAPTALAIKECVRLHAMAGLTCEGPILDVGCGDGLFAQLAFRGAEVWGIDIDGGEGRKAQASRAYEQVLLADITRAQLPASFFGTCVANCSLEHVKNLEAALRNIHRSLRPKGRIFAFLPNREWTAHMLGPRLLSRAGLPGLAEGLRRRIDETFRHEHLEAANGWERWFEGAGFEIVRTSPLGSTASTVAFELFLVPSLLGLASKKVTGRWTSFPSLRALLAPPLYGVVRGLLSAFEKELTAEFLVEARKPER